MRTSDFLKRHGNLLLLLDGRCLEILIVNSRSAKPSVKQQCCLWFWLFASDSNFDFLRIFNSRSATLSINQHRRWLLGWLLANSWMSNSWNVILIIWNYSSAAVDCDSLKVFQDIFAVDCLSQYCRVSVCTDSANEESRCALPHSL